MYAALQYKSRPSSETLLSHIVALLTGTTNLGTLQSSAIIDETQSEINTSSSVAGWSVFDNISSKSVVLRAPMLDFPSKYKYVHIRDKNNDGNLWISLYLDWNATTHAPITPAAFAESPQASIPAKNWTLNGIHRFMLSASPRHIACCTAKDNYTGADAPVIISEFTKGDAWMTETMGIMPVVCSYDLGSTSLTSSIYGTGTLGGYTPQQQPFRMPVGPNVTWNSSEGGISLVTQYNFPTDFLLPNGATDGRTFGNFLQNSQSYNESGVLVDCLTPFGATEDYFLMHGGSITDMSGIYIYVPNFGNTGDKAVINNTEFTVWSFGGTGRFLVKKG